MCLPSARIGPKSQYTCSRRNDCLVCCSPGGSNEVKLTRTARGYVSMHPCTRGSLPYSTGSQYSSRDTQRTATFSILLVTYTTYTATFSILLVTPSRLLKKTPTFYFRVILARNKLRYRVQQWGKDQSATH